MVPLAMFIQDDAENIMKNKTVPGLKFQGKRSLFLTGVNGDEQVMWAITTAWSVASQETVSVCRKWLLPHGEQMMIQL